MPSNAASLVGSRPGSSSSPLKMKRNHNHHNLSVDPTPTTSSTSLHSAGLRAQLHHLLPKSALFHTCVQIHEISNVPLVSGEFGVRWKFRNTSSKRPDGSKSTTFLRLKKNHSNGKGKGKEKMSSPLNGNFEIPSVIIHSETSTSTSTSSSSLANHPEIFTHASSSTSSLPSAEDSSSPSESSSSSEGPLYPCMHPLEDEPAPSRGMTEFLPLETHGVVWEHTLHTTLKMSIARPQEGESVGMLEPCPFKLVVRQKVIPGDINAPKNPRLGAVYLDLAQYAGVKGQTTRRYLLRESKTNATLKLTISLHHIGGDTEYVAPELPKGEIMNGLTDFLETDVYKTRPSSIELYYDQNIPDLAFPSDSSDDEEGHTYEFVEIEEDDRSSSHHGHWSSESGHGHGHHKHHHKHHHRKPFDVTQLPFAYGPRNTELLIDALFNPVPVPVPVVDGELQVGETNNPFAYYVPRQEDEVMDTAKTIRAGEKERAALPVPFPAYESGEDSGSMRSMDSSQSSNEHPTRSYTAPATPQQSRPSTPSQQPVFSLKGKLRARNVLKRNPASVPVGVGVGFTSSMEGDSVVGIVH